MKFLTVFCSLVLCVCMLCSFLPTRTENEILSDTVRLHVIANSDDTTDQMIKLAVRDVILDKLNAILSHASDKTDVEKVILENLDELRGVADDALESMGADAMATVVFSTEYYPEKRYDGYTLPAGEYLSLQVRIGSGEGRNWWCVLYPQLALGASKNSDTAVRTGFSSEQIEILTGGDKVQYKLKFKLLELFRW
ncbi:MAG: stage II sporulation protein R [Clostridia bacterium]|nr:stage II sporulation protein R [Clostridia bacterium]